MDNPSDILSLVKKSQVKLQEDLEKSLENNTSFRELLQVALQNQLQWISDNVGKDSEPYAKRNKV
jgi:hypothetical protein